MFEQVVNVVMFLGIYKYFIVMLDGYQGYGFLIGGVVVFDVKEGVISLGGVGYDINCGVRFIRINLIKDEVRLKIKEFVDIFFKNVLSGFGSKGCVRFYWIQFDDVLVDGVKWVVDNGYGWERDFEYFEEGGRMEGVDLDVVSQKVKQRGVLQFGFFGFGNYFFEVQYVDKVYNEEIVKVYGFFEG